MAQQKQPAPKKRADKKPRIKKISFWAGLFRNFFTIIASIVSVVTLFILIRQNENTYRPDLEIWTNESLFEVRYGENPASCSDIQLYNSSDSLLESLSLNLINLGMGAAKNVEIGWQTDASKMLDTVYIGSHPVATGAYLDRKLNSVIFGNCPRQPGGSERLAFVLPVNQEKSPTQIPFPDNFHLLWSNLLLRTAGSTADAGECAERVRQFVNLFHRISLIVSYLDIDRKTYKKSFSVNIVPRFIDLDARRIIGSVLARAAPAAGGQSHSVTILFPDRSIRTVEVVY